MSLMEEGTGEDLRDLLERGVKLYRKAVEDDAENKVVLQAIGVLRATEHLSMAGLYAARAEAQTEGDLAHAGVAGKGHCRDGPPIGAD